MNDQLLGYLFDDKPHTHILVAPMSRWIALSPRFKLFATNYRDKIRKKIRVTQSIAGIKALEVELETAYWLLQEQRFVVTYEPYNSEKTRGPDFAVTFKSITFNVEVTRISSGEMEQPLSTAENTVTLRLDSQQVGGRLMDTVCDKLGQMRPGMINVLLVVVDSHSFHVLDISHAMGRLKQRAERKEVSLFGRYGFVNAANFFKYYLRLSGVLVRTVDKMADSSLWANNQAKHPIPRPIRTILQRG
jgi:hypothetical protein